MHVTDFLKLCFFSLTVAIAYGDEAANLALRAAFEQLEGDVAKGRDFCFKENSMCITDLVNYDNADDVPERDLCFYKCFYEQIGLIDNGKIVLDDLRVIPELKDLDDEKIEELGKCLQELDDIVECTDLRKVEECFNETA